MARRNSQKERVRNLIALDAGGVVQRLEERGDEMIAMFSLHRDREPLLSPLRSWVPSATFQELSLLSAEQQSAVTGFYEGLDGLRWYFRYTNDMPGTAQQVFAHHRKKLRAAYALLEAALGPAVALAAPAAPEAPEAPGPASDPPPAPAPARPRARVHAHARGRARPRARSAGRTRKAARR